MTYCRVYFAGDHKVVECPKASISAELLGVREKSWNNLQISRSNSQGLSRGRGSCRWNYNQNEVDKNKKDGLFALTAYKVEKIQNHSLENV